MGSRVFLGTGDPLWGASENTRCHTCCCAGVPCGRSAGLVHKSTGSLAGGIALHPRSLFTVALGLRAPWGVADVAFDRPAGRIDFQVAFTPGARFACPHGGAEHQPVHDTYRSGSGAI